MLTALKIKKKMLKRIEFIELLEENTHFNFIILQVGSVNRDRRITELE